MRRSIFKMAEKGKARLTKGTDLYIDEVDLLHQLNSFDKICVSYTFGVEVGYRIAKKKYTKLPHRKEQIKHEKFLEC